MRFGKLTFLSDAGVHRQKRRWRLLCDCGTETTCVASDVRRGKVRSCGCLRSLVHIKDSPSKKHPLYATWCNLKARCDNTANPSYKNYGGRGISYDPAWSRFAAFLADIPDKPSSEATLDRIDNNGNYTKDNIRWTSRVVQRRNSRSIRPVTIGTETRLLVDWCAEYGITIGSVHRRLRSGEDIVSAITRPKAARFLP
jgi:hypothetical protein